MKPSDLSVDNVSKSESGSEPQVAIESTAEWQVYEIGFDGHEQYLQPEIYSDHIARLAHQVAWQSYVAGGSSSGTEPTQQQDASATSDTDTEHEDDIVDGKPMSKKAKTTSTIAEHDGGVWANVAKNLHESLTQLNVLSDVLRVAQLRQPHINAPPYLSVSEVKTEPVDTVDFPSASKDANHQTKEFRARILGFSVASKKLGLMAAHDILSKCAEKIDTMPTQVSELKQADAYLAELQELRKLYRVRKIASKTMGDLGYAVYGPKFEARCVFEIHRRNQRVADVSTAGDKGCGSSHLEVDVPRNLRRKARVVVDVVPDSNDLLTQSDSHSSPPSTTTTSAPNTNDWRSTLYDAQQTLIARDMFAMLSREVVDVCEQGIATVAQNSVLLVHLGVKNYMLRVRLVTENENKTSMGHAVKNEVNDARDRYPTTQLSDDKELNGSQLSAVCTAYLRCMFLSDMQHNDIYQLPFISLPQSDMYNREIRLAGPAATVKTQLSKQQTGLSRKYLITRLRTMGRHMIGLKRCTTLLRMMADQYSHDPSLHWSFIRTDLNQSVLCVTVINKHYERCTRTRVMLEVNADTVRLVHNDTGHAEQFDAAHTTLLRTALVTVINRHTMLCLHQLSHMCGWRVSSYIARNTRETSTDKLSSCLVLRDATGTRSVSIVVHDRADPEITLTDQACQDRVAVQCIPYARMPGATLLERCEKLLCAFVKDVDKQ